MKKILFINALMLAAMLPIFGQSAWNRIPLTGAQAKILSTANSPKFSISLSAAFPLGGISNQNLEIAALRYAAFTPGTAEQLFEKLGGEFTLYHPSSQKQETIEMSGKTSPMPGLRLGFSLGNHFEIRASGQYFKSEWTGEFSVFVTANFPHEPSQSKTVQGGASASASGMLLDVETVFFIAGRGVARPYVKGGARGQFPLQSKSSAEIAGVSLPLEIEPLGAEFSPFGGAGARWSFLKNAFLEAGATFGKLPGGDYKPTLEAGIGCAF
jgi:hypothetical protein